MSCVGQESLTASVSELSVMHLTWIYNVFYICVFNILSSSCCLRPLFVTPQWRSGSFRFIFVSCVFPKYSHFPLCSTAYLSSLSSSVQCWVVCSSYYKFRESKLFMSWVSLMFIFRLYSCHSFSCLSFSFSQFRFQVNFSLFHLAWFLFLLSA